MPYSSRMEVSIVNCEKSQIDVGTSLVKVVISGWLCFKHHEVELWNTPGSDMVATACSSCL